MADGNGKNFDYAGGTPPGSFITNLTRNGNINDNLTVIGGTGSRILDTIAASAPVSTIAPGGNAAVTVTWPIVVPDNQAPSCIVQDSTVGTAALRVHHVESVTTSGSPPTSKVVVRVVNDDAILSHTGTLHCIAGFRPPLM